MSTKAEGQPRSKRPNPIKERRQSRRDAIKARHDGPAVELVVRHAAQLTPEQWERVGAWYEDALASVKRGDTAPKMQRLSCSLEGSSE